MNDVIELESIPTKIEYKGMVWIPENKDKPKPRNIKKPYLIKWIEQFEIGDVFTLDQFYCVHPKLKDDSNGRKRVGKTISSLIKEGRIDQWTNKDEFKVLKI